MKNIVNSSGNVNIDFAELKFTQNEVDKIRDKKYVNWPVVYFIYNDDSAYVGETTNVYIRLTQHLKIQRRLVLKNVLIISDDMFNKSAILDIESTLIKFIDADKQYILQNENTGLQNHNYYQKKIYEKKFNQIWDHLLKKSLAKSKIHSLENSALYKYSPYKTLTPEQYFTIDRLLEDIAENVNGHTLSLVQGGAGTGKTILAIYLMKLLRTSTASILNDDEDMDANYSKNLHIILETKQILEIGLVIPMQSLRVTLKRVFEGIEGLSPNMVISPEEVFDKNYDVLIVDEAHRLKRRKGLGRQFGSFDRHNTALGLDDSGTQLSWIKARSTHQILFYDEGQSIKPSDIRKEEFQKIELHEDTKLHNLQNQLRCLGGTAYVRYINSIFHCAKDLVKEDFSEFEFLLFDNVNDMYNRINDKDNGGLSRMVAGYSWPWKTKGKTEKEIRDNNLSDFEIQSLPLIWNINQLDWIDSRLFQNEVGCIHTTQGYDLNYVGVIIGSDIQYSSQNNTIKAVSENYCDIGGTPSKVDIKDLDEYLINIYITLCLRGIKGVYLFTEDIEFNKYLSRFVDKYKDS